MNKIKIGVSGDIGSFSEQAAKEYCKKEGIKNYKIKYLISVKKVLQALDNKKIDLGIFPIENSIGGIVNETIYAMSKHNFNIKDIFEIPVVHCLLTKPGKNKEDIKTIASHDQALKQCQAYLKNKWSKAQLKETEDTASSAKKLNNGELSDDTAILAPESCATLYGLIVMEKGVQDLKFNFTNFLVAEK